MHARLHNIPRLAKSSNALVEYSLRSAWHALIVNSFASSVTARNTVLVQQALGASVTSGRLFYCTAPGGFTDHEIPINEANSRTGLEALEIIDRAIELGFLPAAPDDGACNWCDFRPVCGPYEVKRVANKSQEKLGDLMALREKP